MKAHTMTEGIDKDIADLMAETQRVSNRPWYYYAAVVVITLALLAVGKYLL